MFQDAFSEKDVSEAVQDSPFFKALDALKKAVVSADKERTLSAISDLTEFAGPFVVGAAICRGVRENLMDILAADMESEIRSQMFVQVKEED